MAWGASEFEDLYLFVLVITGGIDYVSDRSTPGPTVLYETLSLPCAAEDSWSGEGFQVFCERGRPVQGFGLLRLFR